MPPLIININLASTINIGPNIQILSPCFDLGKYSTINLTIDFYGTIHIHPEVLVIIVAVVQYVRAKGKTVDITIKNANYNENVTNYVSRINFFQQLEVDFVEQFNRND